MPDGTPPCPSCPSPRYLMENRDEIRRLELKTDPEVVRRQASWAGLRPGMRVLDAGCGSGKTSSILREMVGPAGSVVGLDGSAERIAHARQTYARPGLSFLQQDLREPCGDPEPFDFVWMRFVLEYFRSTARDIVRNVAAVLRPGGVLCLIDLDHNCLGHYGAPERLSATIAEVVALLERDQDFDPYAGRRLYAHLYDLGFEEIRLQLEAHHLIYGALTDVDAFNWLKKLEVAARDSGCSFAAYGGSHAAFVAEFEAFFSDPRRFTYTPALLCRGRRPGAEALTNT